MSPRTTIQYTILIEHVAAIRTAKNASLNSRMIMYTCTRVGSRGRVRPQARYQLYLFAQPDPFQSASCPHLVPLLRIKGASQPRATHYFTECSDRLTAFNFAEHQFTSSIVVTVSFFLHGSRDTLNPGPAVGCPKYQRTVLIIS